MSPIIVGFPYEGEERGSVLDDGMEAANPEDMEAGATRQQLTSPTGAKLHESRSTRRE